MPAISFAHRVTTDTPQAQSADVVLFLVQLPALTAFCCVFTTTAVAFWRAGEQSVCALVFV